MVFELKPMAGPERLVFAVLAAVGSVAAAVAANVFCCPTPNDGNAAGLAAGAAPNPNELVAPNAGAGANVGAADATVAVNDGVAVVVVVAAADAAGAPNENDDVVPSDGAAPLAAGVAPRKCHSNRQLSIGTSQINYLLFCTHRNPKMIQSQMWVQQTLLVQQRQRQRLLVQLANQMKMLLLMLELLKIKLEPSFQSVSIFSDTNLVYKLYNLPAPGAAPNEGVPPSENPVNPPPDGFIVYGL